MHVFATIEINVYYNCQYLVQVIVVNSTLLS